MKVKHLSYEELVKLGAKCLAQPKAEVQIFCVKNTKISDKVPPQLRAFDNLGGLKMETHNVYLEPSTTEVTLYEKISVEIFTRYVFSVLKRKLKRSFSLGSLRS